MSQLHDGLVPLSILLRHDGPSSAGHRAG